MLPHEVSRIVAKAEEKSEKAPKLKIGFNEGERVKIKEGTFVLPKRALLSFGQREIENKKVYFLS